MESMTYLYLCTKAGVGGTRDALEGLNWPHFRVSSLIAIFECHVCAK